MDEENINMTCKWNVIQSQRKNEVRSLPRPAGPAEYAKQISYSQIDKYHTSYIRIKIIFKNQH